MEIAKNYDPSQFEDKIYRNWEERGYFEAHPNPDKQPYTIVLPPPNITGQLHIGHALDDTIQDVMIRFKRMQGYEALWLPGTDHASIATEVKIVQQMAEEGLTKESLGREGFLRRAWAWKEKYGGRIVEQLKKMGVSCDWSKLSFTMDEKLSRAVRHVFVKLYDKGLIYQGSRIINWCPDCKTAISDAEVEYEEHASHLWHLRYDCKDGSGSVVVATTRPETMLGDTAVAVNPKDKRYAHLVGKTLLLPLINREIPVVADGYVDMKFGTGAVKITPAHDPNDFEVGLRHNLEVVRVMNDDGTMNGLAGKYEGMDRYAAREAIVKDLKERGALVKIENHTHNEGHCYRCHTVIEPIVSKQWFVKMEPLAVPAVEAVKKGETRFVPKRFEKIYFNWMENIKDWCISRQLWWGHRIPAYYCEDCGEVVVCEGEPSACAKCGGKRFRQDEDVLDTWFSSALWPFSTLGYPDRTPELDYFYPTSVLITAYDIIFFWVARMIFSGIEHMGEVPFKDVLIHGIVRDAQGRKMSKSSGNGIDPLEVVEKYGADTLRFNLLYGIAPGSDTRFLTEKLEGVRNFMNKIWNASRFTLMNLEGRQVKPVSECRLTLADKWILTRLNEAVKAVTANLEKYELGNACSKLYDFFWSDFCDWYIELIKPVLHGEDDAAKADTLGVLKHVLETALKLLHPVTPFITEEIYTALNGEETTVMLQPYPEYDKKRVFHRESALMQAVMEVIGKIRNLRAEMNVAPSKRTRLYVKPLADGKAFCAAQPYLAKLGFATEVCFVADRSEVAEKSVSIVTPAAEVYIPLGELVDAEKELARLRTEREKHENERRRAEAKLDNPNFVSKAPKELVEAEREKVKNFAVLLEKVDARIRELS